ncbi:hypothetical protein CYMTET_20249, partial [Cymbomonas tetramitiformis]
KLVLRNAEGFPRSVAWWGPNDLADAPTRLAQHLSSNIPFTTLRHVRMSNVPGKFKCLLRVCTIWPDVNNFCHRAPPDAGPPREADASPEERWSYLVRLTVEDATCSCVKVYLYAEDGEMFFAEVPPQNVGACSAIGSVLQKKMDRLTGRQNGEVPWVPMCLKTYHDLDGNMQIRIFDTVML